MNTPSIKTPVATPVARQQSANRTQNVKTATQYIPEPAKQTNDTQLRSRKLRVSFAPEVYLRDSSQQELPDANKQALWYYITSNSANLRQFIQQNPEIIAHNNNNLLCAVITHKNIDIKMVKYLLDVGCNPNIVNDYGDSILHQVFRTNTDIEILKFFIQEFSFEDLFTANTYGDYPLKLAIIHDNQQALSACVSMYKVQKKTKKFINEKILTMSLNAGSINCVKFLINNKVQTNMRNKESALYLACLHGDLQLTKTIMQRLWDARVHTSISPDVAIGAIALYYAVKSKNIELIEYLITNGAKFGQQIIDPVTKLETTPFEVALETHDTALVKSLLSTLNRSTNYCANGSNVLVLLIKYGYSEEAIHLIQLLPKERNRTNGFNLLLLQEACRFKDIAVIDALVDVLGINSLSFNGSYAINVALQLSYEHSQNTDVIAYLLTKGAEIFYKNQDKLTTFEHLLLKDNNFELCKLFINHIEDINAVVVDNKTPLLLAVEYNRLDIVQYLVMQRRANLNQITGRLVITPLHLAISQGYDEITNYLLAQGACMKSPDN